MFCVFTDGIKTMNLLTDQQLMAIAKLFGAEWKEVAIECLQMEMKDIQQIQAKEQEVNIQKFLLLSKWREREQSNGTAQNLYSRLSEKVSYDIVQLLEGIHFSYLCNCITVSQIYFKSSHTKYLVHILLCGSKLSPF